MGNGLVIGQNSFWMKTHVLIQYDSCLIMVGRLVREPHIREPLVENPYLRTIILSKNLSILRTLPLLEKFISRTTTLREPLLKNPYSRTIILSENLLRTWRGLKYLRTCDGAPSRNPNTWPPCMRLIQQGLGMKLYIFGFAREL